MRRGTHHTEETRRAIIEGLRLARREKRLIDALSPVRLAIYRRERAKGIGRSEALRTATEA